MPLRPLLSVFIEFLVVIHTSYCSSVVGKTAYQHCKEYRNCSTLQLYSSLVQDNLNTFRQLRINCNGKMSNNKKERLHTFQGQQSKEAAAYIIFMFTEHQPISKRKLGKFKYYHVINTKSHWPFRNRNTWKKFPAVKIQSCMRNFSNSPYRRSPLLFCEVTFLIAFVLVLLCLSFCASCFRHEERWILTDKP